jgi:hypothetical protein
MMRPGGHAAAAAVVPRLGPVVTRRAGPQRRGTLDTKMIETYRMILSLWRFTTWDVPGDPGN